MLPGGRSRHKHQPPHWLDRYLFLQPRSPGNVASPGSGCVDEVLCIKDAPGRLHSPGFFCPRSANHRSLEIDGSSTFLRQSQAGKGHTMRVDNTVSWPVGHARNATGFKGDETLRILDGKNAHRSAYAFLHSDAFQVLVPAFWRYEEEIANWAIAR